MKLRRGSPYVRHDGTAVLEVAAHNGYEVRTVVYVFDGADQVLDLAEKLRLVGNSMLIDAKRPGDD